MTQSLEERRAKQRKYARKRYAEDPEYRERKKQRMREYGASAQARERHIERMATDTDYAERKRESSRKSTKRWNESLLALIEAAKNRPCVDCGLQHEPFNMEFDHVRGEKLFSLSKAVRSNHSKAEILTEIEKCDVRCVLCHRRRHFS